MTAEIPAWLPGHSVFSVVDSKGRRIKTTPCMLVRLDPAEFENGRVPADMPEFDVPAGAGCHPDWGCGCDVFEDTDCNDESDGDSDE